MPKKISKEELLNELINLNNQLNRIPTKADINKLSKYSSHPYNDEFGGLENALIIAKLLPRKMQLTSEQVLKEIKDLSDRKSVV